MNKTALTALFQRILNAQALSVITEIEQAAAKQLLTLGRKMTGDEKREAARKELLAFVELQDDKLGAWADLPWCDALEANAVDLAIDTAFGAANSILNALGRNLPQGEAPVGDAPEQSPGGLE